MADKEYRKQIKRDLKQKARTEFEEGLPISREIFQKLFDYLDEKLSEIGCDDTFQITTEFLKDNGVENLDNIENWLKKNGGYCDCEILANVEEKFEDDSIL